MPNVTHEYIENSVCTRVANCLCAHERVILVCISRVAQHKQFVTRVHTLFYFLHDLTYPKMTLKTRISTHHPRVLLARLRLRWWRHNRLVMTSQWPDNCDANTWQVISNSLDIDFIHGDIHGRSCKNIILFLTRHNEFINDAETRVFTHNPRGSFARISNSLDI